MPLRPGPGPRDCREKNRAGGDKQSRLGRQERAIIGWHRMRGGREMGGETGEGSLMRSELVHRRSTFKNLSEHSLLS